MIRILVVEDEPPILRGICNKISKAYEHCEIVYRAYNGQEAIDYLEDHTVDVVFTDINMPLMNGLELLEYVSKKYPDIYTIILSGYQEFQYAQKAVQLGAYDYLLKPLDTDNTRNILEKLSREISQKKLDQVFRGDYLESGIDTRIIEAPIYFISVCIGTFPVKGVPTHIKYQAFWDKIDIENLLQEMRVDSKDYCVVNSIYTREKIIVFRQLSEHKLSLITERIGVYFESKQLPITLIVSQEMNSVQELYECYTTLVRDLPKLILFGKSQIVNLAHKNAYKDYFIPPTEEKKLIHALEKHHISLFKQEMVAIYKKLEQTGISQSNLDAVLNHIVLLCKKTGFIAGSIHDIEIKIYEAMLKYMNYEELFNQVIDAIIEEQPQQPVHMTQDKAYLMDQIEVFIREHITEAITNQVLSEQFGLVPSYISKLFKTYKGVSPSEYILMLRIDKAKEMLIKDPNLLAKDIAEIVGYSDALYFSRVFKKVTGMYPSEYRKNELKGSC